MTEKEKAKELVEKYAIYSWVEDECDYGLAKQLAKMAIDEVVKYAETFGDVTQSDVDYFLNVRKEIDFL